VGFILITIALFVLVIHASFLWTSDMGIRTGQNDFVSALCGPYCSSQYHFDDRSHPISRVCNIFWRRPELSDVNMPSGNEKERRLIDNVYRGRRSQMANGNVNGMLRKQQILSMFRFIVWILDVLFSNGEQFLVHFLFYCCWSMLLINDYLIMI